MPATGYAQSADAHFYSTIRVINAGRAAARLTFDVYTPNAADCAIKPVDLAAGEDATLAYACSGIYAAVIHTDQPLYVRADILALNQRVSVATSWIDGFEDAVVFDVEILGAMRANLFIVNPNDEPLNVHLHIERPEFRKSYDDEVTIAPRSLRIHALHEIEWSGPPPVAPVIVNGMHNVRITADGRYHAGTSSVHAGGDGNWREAVPLGR